LTGPAGRGTTPPNSDIRTACEAKILEAKIPKAKIKTGKDAL
jgi:hypothetical protein